MPGRLALLCVCESAMQCSGLPCSAPELRPCSHVLASALMRCVPATPCCGRLENARAVLAGIEAKIAYTGEAMAAAEKVRHQAGSVKRAGMQLECCARP